MKSNHVVARKMEKRVSFVGAKLLEIIETNFPDVTKNGQWNGVRTQVFDIVNDVIRANREDMIDLYRLPIRRKKDGKIHLSLPAMKIIDSLTFSKKPKAIYVSMTAGYKDLLEDFVGVLGFGDVTVNDSIVSLYFGGGVADEFAKILKLIPMSKNTLERFNSWCEGS